MNILVLDSGGLFTALANSLSMGGKHKVYYYTIWAGDAFPKLQDFAPGTGYDYLIKVKYLKIDLKWKQDAIYTKDNEKIDLVVNFDVGYNDEVYDIKNRYPELSVVGSGLGVVLEDDRVGLKKWCKALGLDLNPISKEGYILVKGIDALEDYCKKNPDTYAKIDIFRQSMETLHLTTPEKELKKRTFIELRKEFGRVFEQIIPFMMEDEIDSKAEMGFDGWHIPRFGYGNKCFAGYEYDKRHYLTRVWDYEDLPKPIFETMDAFIPVLEKMDYRGYLSTEEKIMQDGRHLLIDWCARLLNPGSALYPYAFGDQWVDFNYSMGKKEYYELDFKYKYYGALPLYSKEGKEDYIWLDVNPKYKENVRFLGVCSDGNDNYSIKGKEGMACIVAGDNKWENLIDKLIELAKGVDYSGTEQNQIDDIKKITTMIEAGNKLGIEF